MPASKPSTRGTILDAAETVVARDGSRRLTIDAVAAEASVSKGGVLYHFPNKIALLQGMVERMVTEIGDELACAESRAREAGKPPLVEVFASMFDRSESQDGLSTALLAASAEHPELLDPAREILSTIFQRLAEETPDPVAAHVLMLAMDGLKLSVLLGFNHIPDHQFQPIRDRLLSMARELYT
ncbi:TetR/AcrR family transcriptional regulator [Maricaulis sp.]|uniref:TetR/AcrR family transcriptional regulator n=1 Tax=Maricaulis sp. TaxID=1486257 RepID=UPI0025D320E8|nr:TetR/AcrR family transcriptional regulator [Maricaulis sp.]MDF1768203.1 TetR/AcrR family transcriptional regulator [Maricaulis sp.]